MGIIRCVAKHAGLYIVLPLARAFSNGGNVIVKIFVEQNDSDTTIVKRIFQHC